MYASSVIAEKLQFRRAYIVIKFQRAVWNIVMSVWLSVSACISQEPYVFETSVRGGTSALPVGDCSQLYLFADSHHLCSIMFTWFKTVHVPNVLFGSLQPSPFFCSWIKFTASTLNKNLNKQNGINDLRTLAIAELGVWWDCDVCCPALNKQWGPVTKIHV